MERVTRHTVSRMAEKDPTRVLSAITTGGLVLLMLLFLALTTYSSSKLAEHTESISAHPFEVVIADGEVKTHLSEMQIRTERLTKYNSPEDIRLVEESLDTLFATIQEPLGVIEAQYLGDPADYHALVGTLETLRQELDACTSLARRASLGEIEAYQETRLHPLYGLASEQVDKITVTAQARKLRYGELASTLRTHTLAGSLVLIALMIGGLLLSQRVLSRQRRELVDRGLLFDNLSQSIDDAFLISDMKTGAPNYISLNMERVLGRPVERMEDLCQGFSPEDAEAVREAMGRPDFSSPFAREVLCTQPNGEERRVSVRLYRAAGTNTPRMIGVFSDCTEDFRARQTLKDAMVSAERANEAKSVFLSRMSHEIRTPLNAIIGMTTIAAASAEDPRKVRDCLGKISFSSKHLLMLINDVLDMSKIESDKMVLQKEPFDLFEMINSFVATLYPQARDKGVEFSELMEGFDGQAQYLGDPLRLNQVLLNLGSNAVKFTSAGGRIRLSVSRISCSGATDTIRFALSDTGIGMTQESLGRIFRPFEQADPTIAGRFGGTGLGMSITKNLVALMDGRIEVQSEAGVGTTCIVDLPLLRSDRMEKLPDFANQGLRALVVDDEQAVCEETSALLEKVKIRSEWVLEGAAAVERVTEAQRQGNQFDFCLIDWKMPRMDGVEVTRRIRANVGAGLPIVMISAYDCTEIEEEAKSAGVNAFLPKPLYRSSVYAAIKAALTPEKAPASEAAAARGEAGVRRLLVAEDNALNREILVELLSMHGIEADCAADGREALELFLGAPAGRYDAILMDVQMPVMNGHEAAKCLRASQHPDAESIPIVATTANAFSDDISAALTAGMNAHISKPIDIDRLCAILTELWERRPQPAASAN